MVVQIKALACELPDEHQLPLSRLSIPEIRSEAIKRGLLASIGTTTLWRWLSEDAIRPWNHRSWIFPRDPAFKQKAERILELYEGYWAGKPLGPDDFIVSTDEKTSIQARRRTHPSARPSAGRPMRVEHEYERAGAWAYFAAWDVRRARIYGRCERTTGIAPFSRLVAQVMKRKLYRCAKRVFWIMDNGSSHRGEASIERLISQWPNIIPVYTPVHASWLNQVEVYFSIVQRKVLTPNDFSSMDEVADRLARFAKHYERVATPFQWRFTRRDLRKLLAKLQDHEDVLAPAA